MFVFGWVHFGVGSIEKLLNLKCSSFRRTENKEKTSKACCYYVVTIPVNLIVSKFMKKCRVPICARSIKRRSIPRKNLYGRLATGLNGSVILKFVLHWTHQTSKLRLTQLSLAKRSTVRG